jgi:branched-subunit amino acid aminotransferase/4-amino-4-deoxychorismate lyase
MGVFETVGVKNGTAPLWPLHERRLLRGAVRLGLAGRPPGDLLERVLAAAAVSGLVDPIVRVTWRPAPGGPAALELTPRPRVELGRAVRLVPVTREAGAPDPFADVKHTDRAFYDAARARALSAGADDALILDPHGRVLETSTCNLLWSAGGEWRTPLASLPLLPGIARALLLDALAARGTPAREGTFALADLEAADEVLVTNAVYGPRPACLLGQREPALEPDHPLARVWGFLLSHPPA